MKKTLKTKTLIEQCYFFSFFPFFFFFFFFFFLSTDTHRLTVTFSFPNLPHFIPESAKRNCSRRQSIYYYFNEKIRLDISCESSAWQTIHMKCQAEFSPEKKINMSSAAVVIRTLGIKSSLILVYHVFYRFCF